MFLKKLLWFFVIFIGAMVIAIVLFAVYPRFFMAREVIFYSNKEGKPSEVPKNSEPVVSFVDKNILVKAELAVNPYQWTRGLMFRDKLEGNAGMLFVFPDEAPRTFWMKNVSFSLDIIFISNSPVGELIVADVKENFAPCDSFLSCPNYDSRSAMYALEVNSGFISKNGIEVGDKVEINK